MTQKSKTSLYRTFLLFIGIVVIIVIIGRNRVLPSLAETQACSGVYQINELLPTGGRWQLCWEERPLEGIVLSEISYTTPTNVQRRVLNRANLAQIHVPLDDNSLRLHQLTDVGLGGASLVNLSSAECPNGTLLANNSKNVLCKQILERGFVYKDYNNRKQGYLLNLFSVSIIGKQTYVVQWKFHDDGTIEPSVGTSGEVEWIGTNSQYGWQLNNSGRVGIGFTNNYWWRLDFDLGGDNANDAIQEIEAVPDSTRARKTISITQLTSEIGRTVNPDTKRSWRVYDKVLKNTDGHVISYQIEPLHTGNNYLPPSTEPWATNDIYFTVNNPCELYVSQNPTTGGCGANLSTFINGQSIDGTDIIVWYSLTRHELPRDEDEAYREITWDSFYILPRDWTDKSPITP